LNGVKPPHLKILIRKMDKLIYNAKNLPYNLRGLIHVDMLMDTSHHRRIHKVLEAA